MRLNIICEICHENVSGSSKSDGQHDGARSSGRRRYDFRRERSPCCLAAPGAHPVTTAIAGAAAGPERAQHPGGPQLSAGERSVATWFSSCAGCRPAGIPASGGRAL